MGFPLYPRFFPVFFPVTVHREHREHRARDQPFESSVYDRRREKRLQIAFRGIYKRFSLATIYGFPTNRGTAFPAGDRRRTIPRSTLRFHAFIELGFRASLVPFAYTR